LSEFAALRQRKTNDNNSIGHASMSCMTMNGTHHICFCTSQTELLS